LEELLIKNLEKVGNFNKKPMMAHTGKKSP